jgi:Tfp pilus assembly protein PilV
VQRGFTVLEALIAATLLSAAIVSIAQLLAISAQGSLASRAATTALMSAEQKMEELRAASWAAVAASPAGTDYIDQDARQTCRSVPPAPCPDAAYIRRWTAVPATFTPTILIIEVQVLPSGPAHGKALLVSAKAQRSR